MINGVIIYHDEHKWAIRNQHQKLNSAFKAIHRRSVVFKQSPWMFHYLPLGYACLSYSRVYHEYLTFLSSSAGCSRLWSSMARVHGVAYFCVKITIIIHGQKTRATVSVCSIRNACTRKKSYMGTSQTAGSHRPNTEPSTSVASMSVYCVLPADKRRAETWNHPNWKLTSWKHTKKTWR